MWEHQGRTISFTEVLDRIAERYQEVRRFFRTEDAFLGALVECPFRLVVGTDSLPSSWPLVLDSSVVFDWGYLGRLCFAKRRSSYARLKRKQRLLDEAHLSIILAANLLWGLQARGIPIVARDVEVHLDINPHGESREALAEAVALVERAGFVCMVKPDAWAASKVADRLARQRLRRPVLEVSELLSAI